MKRRLLVLACAQRKTDVRRPVTAWDLYDGQAYRVAKALERRGAFPGDVDVVILSAEHGLITREAVIAPYDRKMTLARALEIGPAAAAALRARVRSTGDEVEVLVVAGKLYRDALELPRLGLRSGTGPGHLLVAGGGIGEQVGQMRDWLVNGGVASQTRIHRTEKVNA